MFKYREVLHAFVKQNPTCVFHKSTMEAAILRWQAREGMDNFMLKNRPATFINDQTYNLCHMLQCCRDILKSMKSGSKLPVWLKEIVQMIEVDWSGNASSSADLGGGRASSKQELLEQSAAKRTRCVLRRVSSTTSVSPTEFYEETVAVDDVPQETVAVDDKPEETVVVDDVPVWFDEAKDVAMRSQGGSELPPCYWDLDPSGFVLFKWKDGFTWLSERPALGYVMPGATIKKKPAAAAATEPAPRKSTPAKLVRSRAYHGAIAAHKKLCKEKGKDFDMDAAKALARAAAVQAAKDAGF